MRRAVLAQRLISARTARERAALLSAHPKLADEELGDLIRKECYSAWTTEPKRSQAAAAAIRSLAKLNAAPALKAACRWVEGIAEITRGRFETASRSLEDAFRLYRSLGRDSDGAQAYVANVLALAMLGRYKDAETAAKTALTIFINHEDALSAGKIELNLSNLVSRQGREREAERHGIRALEHFAAAGEATWQAMAENSLANTYAELNDLELAERHYKRALEIATARKMAVTVAEIEASLGNLYVLNGEYDRALRYLELSRQKYDVLDMPHQSAVAELEMADIYSELNLWAEAKEIYGRVSGVFARYKLRSEEARARLGHARVCIKSRDLARAARELSGSRRLYRHSSNTSGELATLLSSAELEMEKGRSETALETLRSASRLLAKAENPRRRLEFLLIEAEARRTLGQRLRANRLFTQALKTSKELRYADAEQNALTGLGAVASAANDHKAAARYLNAAVERVQEMRLRISADEFAPWFLAGRLRPYEELAKKHLQSGNISQAFEVVELGRPASLFVGSARQDAPPELLKRWNTLRKGLNAQYKMLDTATDDDKRLQSLITKTENELARISRQISGITAGDHDGEGFDRLHHSDVMDALGKRRTLVEFTETDGVIGAFVVTASDIHFVADICTSSDLRELLTDLHFQLDACRYGTAALERFGPQMKARTDNVLERLGGILMTKILPLVKGDQLVVVPAGQLFYVPLAALRCGDRYLVEDHELTVVPSAGAWSRLSRRPRRKLRKTLLVGFADETIPLVEEEIRSLASIVEGPTQLTGSDADHASFLDQMAEHDAIHVACHGRFRADNPMYSSLHLADGWITVRDLTRIRTRARLVTLSACETGLSQINPGNEVLGLSRGFFRAGASSLVMSLWNVNDKSATMVMAGLYEDLRNGARSTTALKNSLKKLACDGVHPYFWAPFIHMGA